jgi:hypothetical protein
MQRMFVSVTISSNRSLKGGIPVAMVHKRLALLAAAQETLRASSACYHWQF